MGNRVEITTDSDDAAKDRTVTYSYDDNDRLFTETSDAVTGDDTHTIYSWGNATGTVGGTATQQTGKKVWESLDTSGDVLETVTYAYSLQGRLAQATIVKGGDTTVLTYAYDDSGIRVGQTEIVNAGTPVVTQYLVDHNNHTGYQQVLEEFIDAVLAQTNAGTTPDTYQFLYDAHGSTRALLDTLAIIAQFYAYDAYGNALGFNTSAALTSLLYSGEQFDQKLAMQYLRARYSDAGTGRFNRVDPFFGNIGIPLTLHKYMYVGASPITYADPSGEVWTLIEQTITQGINAYLRYGHRVKQINTATTQVARTLVKLNLLTMAVLLQTFPDLTKNRGLSTFAGAYYIYLFKQFEKAYRYNKDDIDLKAHIPWLGGYLAALPQGADRLRAATNLKSDARNPDSYAPPRFGLLDHGATPKELVFIPYTGSRRNDFRLAQAVSVGFKLGSLLSGIVGDVDGVIAAATRGLPKFNSARYVWHHNEILGVMELIPKKPHRPTHNGGVYFYELLLNKDYKR